MSGGGNLIPEGQVAGIILLVEADVLAYLARRRANAETVAKRMSESEPFARDRVRQLDVIIEEIRAGLHRGEADLMEGEG